MTPKRILWPTDLRPGDDRPLEIALTLAKATDAELVVAHVVADPAEVLYGDDASEGKDRSAWSFWKIVRADAEGRLQQEYGERIAEVRSRCLAAVGDPAGQVMEMVSAEKVDLVVLAGRPRPSRLFGQQLGAVAYRLVRELPCDVLVIKTAPAGEGPS